LRVSKGKKDVRGAEVPAFHVFADAANGVELGKATVLRKSPQNWKVHKLALGRLEKGKKRGGTWSLRAQNLPLSNHEVRNRGQRLKGRGPLDCD